jgi:molecular chaperone GrpE (heat shock protein)
LSKPQNEIGLLNNIVKGLRIDKDNLLNEIKILKANQLDANDPNEIASLKKRIARLESDLKDKTEAYSRISAELENLKNVMEELRRKASVSPS